jgi:GDPmannose 4,6-dehydratase
MTAIIFGSNGQDGHYLAEFLRQRGHEVLCVSRSNSPILGDVSDYPLVDELISRHKPAFIFHFAANSTARHEALFENHKAICTGTINILESARLHAPTAKIFLSGSALQFKNDNIPIDEQTPFAASSAYSVARIQSVYAGRYYRTAFGMKIYAGYFFNHDSPLRTEKHVNQKITAAVKRIAAGSRETLELGNVDVQKEFNYAGDVVEAIWTLVNQDRIFEAVIGSGEAHSIKEWVEYCFTKVGKKWQDHVVLNHQFKAEYQTLVCDPRVIKSLGWRPKVSFTKLADMMMTPCG